MRFNSAITPKGNSSFSYVSQEDADVKARWLDENGCSRCSYCSDCSYCSGCSGCSDCSDCSDCSYCSRCSYCSDCSDCSGCSYCSGCSDCSDCSGDVIQAGRPNNWPCYGWLKDGKLQIHAGCRRKTYAEAMAYWENKPNRAEVLAACGYIAHIARLRGWEI